MMQYYFAISAANERRLVKREPVPKSGSASPLTTSSSKWRSIAFVIFMAIIAVMAPEHLVGVGAPIKERTMAWAEITEAQWNALLAACSGTRTLKGPMSNCGCAQVALVAKDSWSHDNAESGVREFTGNEVEGKIVVMTKDESHDAEVKYELTEAGVVHLQPSGMYSEILCFGNKPDGTPDVPPNFDTRVSRNRTQPAFDELVKQDVKRRFGEDAVVTVVSHLQQVSTDEIGKPICVYTLDEVIVRYAYGSVYIGDMAKTDPQASTPSGNTPIHDGTTALLRDATSQKQVKDLVSGMMSKFYPSVLTPEDLADVVMLPGDPVPYYVLTPLEDLPTFGDPSTLYDGLGDGENTWA